jgi:hypothetical protein
MFVKQKRFIFANNQLPKEYFFEDDESINLYTLTCHGEKKKEKK